MSRYRIARSRVSPISRLSRQARLQLQSLEQRTVPANLLVTALDDIGNAGDFRSVWETARTNGDADVIEFDPTIFTGPATITLNSPLSTYDEGFDLEIKGLGAASITLSGGNFNRIFTINVPSVSPTFTLKNMTLADGAAPSGNGGAIQLNNDPLVLDGVVLTNNRTTLSSQHGGAIAATAANTITISNSTFTNNSALGSSASGGAIFGSTSLTVNISNSTFSNNSAAFNGGVIACNLTLGLDVQGSSFSTNTAGGSGVGGVVYSLSTLTASTGIIGTSSFTGNSAGGGGGALGFGAVQLSVTDTTFTNNKTPGATDSGGGAIGIRGAAPTLNIVNCTFSNNSITSNSTGGGALFVLGGSSATFATITDTTFTNNVSTTSGGAIRFSSSTNATVIIDHTLISSNTTSGTNSSYGGGIDMTLGGNLTVKNSAIVNNVAVGTSGGGYGGAIATSSAAITIENSTLSGNSAFNNSTNSNVGGGAIRVSSLGTIGALTIRNSTIAHNTAANSVGATVVRGGAIVINSTGATAPSILIESSIIANNSAPLFRDIFVAQGTGSVLRNVAGDNSLYGAADTVQFNLTGTSVQFGAETAPLNPGIYALANNGGLTPTHALWYNSPALNEGLNTQSFLYDQRFDSVLYPRVVGGTPDIGAHEGVGDLPFVFSSNGLVDVTTPGATPYAFTVTFDDSTGIDASSINKVATGSVVVTTPAGGTLIPSLTSATPSGNQLVAVYSFNAPGGAWDPTENGLYTVKVAANKVFDNDVPQKSVPEQTVGTFSVKVAGAIVVDNNANDLDDGIYTPGNVTLREAINLSNASPGQMDTISFNFGGPATITLGGFELGVTDPVIINGPGIASLSISGNLASRIFNFNVAGAGNAESKVSALTLTQGSVAAGADGGAVLIDNDPVSFDSVAFVNNSASGSGANGGAINVGLTQLKVTNSTFSNNTSQGTGGAINSSATSGASLVEISNSLLENNQGSTGGAVNMPSQSGAQLTIANSQFTGNVATAAGGAIGLTTSPFSISGSTFSGNVAQSSTLGGGAITSNTSVGTVLNSTFSGNSATGTSGVAGAWRFGGAGNVTIQNSTFSGNSAATSGGAFASGSAVSVTLTLKNSTVTNNTAGSGLGGAFFSGSTSSQPVINIISSIVAKNSDSITADINSALVAQTPTLNVNVDNSILGLNNQAKVVVNATGSTTVGTTTGFDPLLGPLANNGGTTLTHEPLPGSYAINKGSNPDALTLDQRGKAREVGVIDMGSVEVQATAPPPTASVKVNGSASAQRSMVTSLVVTFSSPVNFPSGMAAAFTLTRTGPTGPTGAVTLDFSPTGGPTSTVTITFNDATFAPLVGSKESLIDGTYTLTIVAANVVDLNSQPLDGDGNGTGGDNFVTPNSGPNRLHRLFGDVNGDGFTDNVDLIAFRNANGSDSTMVNYDPAFDVNGDGFIDNIDFVAFRQRIGESV